MPYEVRLTPIRLQTKTKGRVTRNHLPNDSNQTRLAKISPPLHLAGAQSQSCLRDRLQEKMHNIRSLLLLQNCIDRAPHTPTTTLENVRVDHRRPHIRMTQQLLNRPDVVPVLDKMRGK
jgi:hypothetical protein